MFGLENQKKKKSDGEFIFDLEKDFKNTKTQKAIKAKVESRIQKIKEALRSGENQGVYDKYGIILHGYASLLKVMARCGG